MEDSFKENGSKTTWKAWVFIPGQTVAATWASTKTTKKHGYGIYKWVDGRIYLGQWWRGKQHGLGVYQQVDNTTETPTVTFKHGLWEEGKRIEWFDQKTLEEINS